MRRTDAVPMSGGPGRDALGEALRRDAEFTAPNPGLRGRTLRATSAAERESAGAPAWGRWAMWAGAGLMTAAVGVALLPRGAEPTTSFDAAAATQRIAMIRASLGTGARALPARVEKPIRDEAKRWATGARAAAERALNPWRPVKGERAPAPM